MHNAGEMAAMPEPQFAALVSSLAAAPAGREQLTEMLSENHPLYDQRGRAAIVRMRGWILLALSHAGVSDADLLFVLEELDTGADAYLVAAAARALRSYPVPSPDFAPFVIRAIANIRYHNEHVSFDNYGEYAVSSAGTSPVRELLATLVWLGPSARGVLHELESLRAHPGGFSRKLLNDVDKAVKAIRASEQVNEADVDKCCALPSSVGSMFAWKDGFRRKSESIESIVFEDHEGAQITFKEFFQGHPSIVVFFYTRCDNPLKCSLTITKLGRIQKLLEERNVAGQIYTAAITYDPAFDSPKRLRFYGQNRGVNLDSRHRMLRTTDGFNALRKQFKLGVNFIESLVNRHRIEAYILDAEGRIAASFERLQWDESRVVDCAVEMLKEKFEKTKSESPVKSTTSPIRRSKASPMLGALASVGVAFFPKCPICWIAYLSMFGIAGLEQIPYSPWLQPLFLAVMLINLASVWFRGRSIGQMKAFYLVATGALLIMLSKMGNGESAVAILGIALTFIGSVLSALSAYKGAKEAPSSV